MKITLIILFGLMMNVYSFAQDVYSSHSMMLLKDFFENQYLGSNKNNSRNYFFHKVSNQSGFQMFDVLPNRMGVIFCTNEKAQILWMKTIHNAPNSEFHGTVYTVKVDDDRLIVYCAGGKEGSLYFDNTIVNEKPLSTVLLFIDTAGSRISIPFIYSDTQIPEQDIKISNITNDGTFAFSISKLGTLTINNLEVKGDSGVYLVKAKIDYRKNKIDVISSKKVGVNLHKTSSIANRFLRFDCTVLENKAVIISNPSSLFFGIITNDKVDTVVNTKEPCYYFDKDLAFVAKIKEVSGKVFIKTDVRNNICFRNIRYGKIPNFEEKPKDYIVVVNANREIVWQDSLVDFQTDFSFKDNVVYLLRKNYKRHNLELISYNFDLRRIDIAKKQVKDYSSPICDTQLLHNFDMVIISSTEDEVTFGYQIKNQLEYDWEKGCKILSLNNGFVVSKLTFR